MKNLSFDLARYYILLDDVNIRSKLYLFIFSPAIWFLVSYRFGRWVRHDCDFPIIKFFLKVATQFSHFFICLITGIDIPFAVRIGRGFHISHFGGIVVNPAVTIGEFCNIGPGVVIGVAGRKEDRGVPIIGNMVYMGSGAKILGKIIVSNHTAIGANAVVTKSLPPYATAVGIPARVINTKGSVDFIRT